MASNIFQFLKQEAINGFPDPVGGFNINEFRTTAFRNGVLKNNLYLVRFSPRSGAPRELIYFTDSVSIPMIDSDTQAIQRYGYGPLEYVPFRPVFAPMSMNFIVDSSNQNLVNYTADYMSKLFPFMGYKTMSARSNPLAGGVAAGAYEVAYKDDYAFDIEVYVYNETQQSVLIYTFRDCFAKNMSGLDLNWNDTNQLARVTVQFVYTDFGVNASNLLIADGLNAISGLQAALKFKTIPEALNAIQYPATIIDSINVSNAENLVSSTVNSVGSAITNLASAVIP